MVVLLLQEVGKVEAAFASVDTATLITTFLATKNPNPPMIPVELGLNVLFKGPPVELPSWLTQQDINYYAAKFHKTGFTGGLNYYRAMDLYVFQTFFQFLISYLGSS